MSDPRELLDLLDRAEDAFGHAYGAPSFEPGPNHSTDAADGEVPIQKACRSLELIHALDEVGEYYGAILEHSFIIVEQTFQGYLLAMTGVEERELRDHDTPYELARGQVPLEDRTIESLKSLYDGRRTEHYYGTTVTTGAQAETMRDIAAVVHHHVVGFDPDLDRYCNCPEIEA